MISDDVHDDVRLSSRGAVGLGWAAAVGGVALAALALYAIDESALDGVRQRDLAETTLARAAHAILMTPYSVLSMLEYDDNTAAGRDAPVHFVGAVREAKSALDEALQLAPEDSAAIAEFRQRFDRLAEKAEGPFLIGNATPGITKGPDLTSRDLAELASGAKMAAEIDGQLQALAQDVRTLEDALNAENLGSMAKLKVWTDIAIASIAAAGLAGLIVFRISGRRGSSRDLAEGGGRAEDRHLPDATVT